MQMGESIEEIHDAIEALQKGEFVLIYDADDREGETDFVMAAEFVKKESICKMRTEGGGLIFLMISHEIASRFNLPFLSEIYEVAQNSFPVLQSLYANDIPYDSRSSFSLYINHRKTFTGITDIDRSLTISGFAKLAKTTQEKHDITMMHEFGKQFRTPGHVPICIASEQPLKERFGHTELSVALLMMAGLCPVASGCEIMDESGKAMSKQMIKKLALDQDIVFLEGKSIIESWHKWSK
jgi:3,4-dihydroxy 2-butanone 4-phosphate synthase